MEIDGPTVEEYFNAGKIVCVLIITILSLRSMNTYQQAKDIYINSSRMQDNVLFIAGVKNIRAFRKHLTEFEYRKKEGKQFVTKILDGDRILVMRIK